MNPLKSAKPSSEAHLSLRRLYDERITMSQEEFGTRYGIGTQSMVNQYLTGKRPLNVEAAAKFARGLGCTIYDISPEMANAMKEDIFPILGPKGWWGRRLATKVALVVVSVLPPYFVPHSAEAKNETASVYYVKRFWRKIWPHRIATVT